MVLACGQQPSAYLSHTPPPKPAHSPQCFMYYPRDTSTWPCLKSVLTSWAPAPDVEPLLSWCSLVTVPWAPWTQHVQPKLLLPDPGETIWANGLTVTQLPEPDAWDLYFSPSLPRSSWLARGMELPFQRNTISLAHHGLPSCGHQKSTLATGDGLFWQGWVVSFRSPEINACKTLLRVGEDNIDLAWLQWPHVWRKVLVSEGAHFYQCGWVVHFFLKSYSVSVS